MLDPHLQERFARGCSDAAFGYTAATTAAYAAFAEQVLKFWADALTPPQPEAKRPSPTWSWPVPAPVRQPSPFPAFFWPAAAQRQTTQMGFGFPFGAFPMTAFAFPPAPAANPFQAWFGFFPMPTPAWPMAFMLMASGMPHAVAWPTAEANAAVMDAADAAAVSVRKAFASYRSEGGHSVSRQAWAPDQLMMLAAMLPLSFAAMLAGTRLA